MFGVRFYCCGERQSPVKVPVIRCLDIDHAELTLRERAGFIEDDHIDLARGFERKAIAHEDAIACAQSRW
jgi:hypothetical protein